MSAQFPHPSVASDLEVEEFVDIVSTSDVWRSLQGEALIRLMSV